MRSGVGKEAFKLRAERVERSFKDTLDRGGMRRAWLRGRENVQKCYLVHVAAYNLGLVMRALLGAGTARELAAKGGLLLWFFDPAAGFVLVLLPPLARHQIPVHQRPVNTAAADPRATRARLA